MLVVLQRPENASEYLFPCLIHPQIHARTHAHPLLLSGAIPHIHATTTTTTASIPTRCLCSSVRSVCEKDTKSRFQFDPPRTPLSYTPLSFAAERVGRGGEVQISNVMCVKTTDPANKPFGRQP